MSLHTAARQRQKHRLKSSFNRIPGSTMGEGVKRQAVKLNLDFLPDLTLRQDKRREGGNVQENP